MSFQVDSLERDALQVLSLVRSTKNSLALINEIPPDVLSLIPNYWEDSDRDEGLVALTHVCRGWRDLFTSCPLVWTRLDCTDANSWRSKKRNGALSLLDEVIVRNPDAETRFPRSIINTVAVPSPWRTGQAEAYVAFLTVLRPLRWLGVMSLLYRPIPRTRSSTSYINTAPASNLTSFFLLYLVHTVIAETNILAKDISSIVTAQVVF